jgi:hypothetical protein
LYAKVQHGLDREPPAAGELRERGAVNVLHDQVWPAPELARLVQRDDVGVIQPGDDPGLPREACPVLIVRPEVGRQALERDVAIEPGVVRQLHLTHAAGAQRSEDLVGTEGRACDQHGLPPDFRVCDGARPTWRGSSWKGVQCLRAVHADRRLTTPSGPRGSPCRRPPALQ